MHYLIALIYFVLALLGVDGVGSHTIVTHSAVNGVDVLYSRARVVADVADISCIRSASGSCHYRLLTHACTAPRPRATAVSACTSAPAEQFAVAMGASRQIVGLAARFTLCVGQDSEVAHAECETMPTVDPLPSRW
ncbi:MAG: hypothetical protein ABI178_00870 [Rhodanobacter sp.]